MLLQTVLTAWKTAAVPVTITLHGISMVTGIITDDGSTTGDDSILLANVPLNSITNMQAANASIDTTNLPKTVIPKAAISNVAYHT